MTWLGLGSSFEQDDDVQSTTLTLVTSGDAPMLAARTRPVAPRQHTVVRHPVAAAAVVVSDLAAALALVVVRPSGWQSVAAVGALIAALLLAPNAGLRPTLKVLDHAPWLLRSIAIGLVLASPVAVASATRE